MNEVPKLLSLTAGAVIIITAGCMTAPENAAEIEVPFHPQTETNQCGIVSLAMAMDYYGAEYNITNLSREAYIPLLNGSTFSLLSEAAEHRGLKPELAELSPAQLKETVNSKKIAVIYIPPVKNKKVGHFAVVTGVSQNLKKIRIHGPKTPNIWIRVRKLLKRGGTSTFPTLLISNPKS